MHPVFIIVDCSGSMNSGGLQRIGQLNELLRGTVSALWDAGVSVAIITYADTAAFHKEMSADGVFYEIAAEKFVGRSNLGRAYNLVEAYIRQENIPLNDCVIALISDGAATDNFALHLKNLDKNGESKRAAFALTSESSTLLRHVGEQDDLLFQREHEREFIAKVIDFAVHS